MSRLVDSFYRKKLKACKKKRTILKKAKKGAVTNGSNKKILRNITDKNIEQEISDITAQITYYQKKVYGRKRFDG